MIQVGRRAVIRPGYPYYPGFLRIPSSHHAGGGTRDRPLIALRFQISNSKSQIPNPNPVGRGSETAEGLSGGPWAASVITRNEPVCSDWILSSQRMSGQTSIFTEVS